MLTLLVCAASALHAQNVSTQPQLKNVLLEDFTGIRCGNCPDGHRYMERIMMAQPGRVHCIGVHYGSFAIAHADEPDFLTDEGEAIGSYYGPTSFPSGMVNRHEFDIEGTIMGRSNWALASRIMCHEIAPVNVWVESKYNKETNTVGVDVELCYTKTMEAGSTALCIALTQSNIMGPQSGGLVGDEYIHNHVLRAYLTPVWGNSVDESTEGNVLKFHYDYVVPEKIKNVPMDPQNLSICAFVVDATSHEVLNVESTDVEYEGKSLPMEATLEAYKIIPVRNYGFNFFECYIKNGGTEPITSANFNVGLNGDVKTVNWTGNIPGLQRGYVRLPIDWSGQDTENDYTLTLTGINGESYNGGKLKGSFNSLLDVEGDLKMKITTDKYADDNTYRLLDVDGNVVEEYGPYEDGVARSYTETIHFPKSGVYCLEIADSWGNGILAPRGSVKWYDENDKLIAQNTEITDFGYRIFFNYKGSDAPSAEGLLGWGWNYDLEVTPTPRGTNQYDTETVIGSDGTIWFYYYSPQSTAIEDIHTTTYEMRLQALNPDGTRKFGDKGLLISSYPNSSYTVVNQYLCANSDGSVTLAIPDFRNGDPSERHYTYTAYRINPDGTHAWDEEGVNLDEVMMSDFAACMSIIELTDGSNVFAWMRQNGNGYAIERQRVSKEGECTYNLADTRIAKADSYFEYPYLVPAEDGQYIMVYARTSSLNIFAHKYNADGTDAWEKETRIYRGGWGSVNALQIRMEVIPSGDGGVVMSWYDDRAYTQYYSAFIAYIKADGSVAFYDESGEPGVKMSFSGLNANDVHTIIDPAGDGFISIFCEYDGNQTWQMPTIQKVSKNGELLYGDNGINLHQLVQGSTGYNTIKATPDGKLLCFWQEYYNYWDVDNYMSVRNVEDGSVISDEMEMYCLTNTERGRSSMKSYEGHDSSYCLVQWKDYGIYEDKEEVICMARINYNFDPSNPDAIDAPIVNRNADDTYMYNIQGQRVSNSTKGLVIKNGKKYFLK